jgi:hypothetical protein
VRFALEAGAADPVDTALVPDEVVPLDEPLPPAPDRRLDPASAAVYAQAPGREPPARFGHLLTLALPPSGEVILRASATLSSGFDRQRWRRTNYEQAHALHKRADPFVYQFAVRGPDGPVTVVSPPDTAARARLIGGVVHAAAAARRPPPVGLTLGIGPAVSSLQAPLGSLPGDQPPRPQLVQGLVRASLDILLPQRDALALSAEVGTNFTDGHHVNGALVYQLYTPVWPYLPIGGHLDVGASCDLWQSRGPGFGLAAAPSLRCGPRLALGLNALFAGLSVGADVFPLSEPDPYAPGGPGTANHVVLHYRVAVLATVGL